MSEKEKEPIDQPLKFLDDIVESIIDSVEATTERLVITLKDGAKLMVSACGSSLTYETERRRTITEKVTLARRTVVEVRCE